MRRTLLLIVVLLVPPGAAAVVAGLRHFPRRFAEVGPNGLYRGGFPTEQHIRNLASEKRIKTIISLTDYKDEPKYNDEIRAAKEASIRLHRFKMPGNGCADFGALDAAADAIGNRDNWPVFFHCDAGKQRSNAALAAYRMKECGWTVDQALQELEDHHGLDRESEGVLVEHLREYAERCAASGRPPERRTSQEAND